MDPLHPGPLLGAQDHHGGSTSFGGRSTAVQLSPRAFEQTSGGSAATQFHVAMVCYGGRTTGYHGVPWGTN